MHFWHLFWRTCSYLYGCSQSLSLSPLIYAVPLLSPSCPVSPLSPSSFAAFSLTLSCQHLFCLSCQLSILSFLPPFPLSSSYYSLYFISCCSAVSFSSLYFFTLSFKSFLSIIFLLYGLSRFHARSLYCHFVYLVSRPCRMLYLYFPLFFC